MDMADVQVLDDNIYEQRASRRLEADAGEEGSISHPDEHQASTSVGAFSEGEREGEDDKEGHVDLMETDDVPTSESRVPSSTREKAPGSAACFIYSSASHSTAEATHWSTLSKCCFIILPCRLEKPRCVHCIALC